MRFSGITRAILLFFSVVLILSIPATSYSQSVPASSTCPPPNWEDILGYQPFTRKGVEPSFIVFWANYAAMEVLYHSPQNSGGLGKERRDKILTNLLTETGRQSLQELYRQLGYDRVFEGLPTDSSETLRGQWSVQGVMPVPTAAGQVWQGPVFMPDKDGDGVNDGMSWQVLGTYHLSYKLLKENPLYGKLSERRVSVMLNIFRPQGKDRLYVTDFKLADMQEVR